MNLSEQKPDFVSDGDMRKLVLTAKNIQDYLLEQANVKPNKVAKRYPDPKLDNTDPKKFKAVIEQIFEFK